MVSQRKVMKILILVILAVFLLSSWLVSVMYFVDMSKQVSEQALSWDIVSGENNDIQIDVSSLGSIPAM